MVSLKTWYKTIFGGLAAMALPFIAAQGQSLQWVDLSGPSPWVSLTMAYDPIHLSTVLFGGGDDEDAVFGDTWIWRGFWRQVSPANSPPPRRIAAMVFDEAAGNVVLFGGNSYNITTGMSGLLNDTWTWDGTTWTQQFPPVSPPARLGAGMAYDAASKKVVLFGGMSNVSSGSSFNDTWIWDGVAKTWTQQSPSNSPSARNQAPMAYNAATATVLVFGGRTITPFSMTPGPGMGPTGLSSSRRLSRPL
jgi:hypothetical protein